MTHARIEGNQVAIMDGGRWIADNMIAWRTWLSLSDSPLPSSQERAREIRAALDEVKYLHD